MMCANEWDARHVRACSGGPFESPRVEWDGSTGVVTTTSTTTVYPCDAGTGLPVGYHHFEAGEYGIICCRLCGKTP